MGWRAIVVVLAKGEGFHRQRLISREMVTIAMAIAVKIAKPETRTFPALARNLNRRLGSDCCELSESSGALYGFSSIPPILASAHEKAPSAGYNARMPRQFPFTLKTLFWLTAAVGLFVAAERAAIPMALAM
jgi:hypothetical protein